MSKHFLARFCFLALLALAGSTRGQTITQTAIVGHGQAPVPRFTAHYDNTLIVPAEHTVVLPPDSDYNAIEVSGTLKVSRDYDTRCRFVVITVLPGGTLDMGTAADPVLRRVEFVVKDRPLLTGTDERPGVDPYQFGNGILIFGQWVAHGRQLDRRQGASVGYVPNHYEHAGDARPGHGADSQSRS